MMNNLTTMKPTTMKYPMMKPTMMKYPMMKKSVAMLLVLTLCIGSIGCTKSEQKTDALKSEMSLAQPTAQVTLPPAAEEQPAPKGFRIDSTTQKALDSDAKAKELYAKVKAIEDGGKASEKKTEAIAAYMEFGNYMMFKAPVSPRIKYRPALKAYSRVLELEANNAEAAKNKKMIEDIYNQMGLPIPKD
jgi:hypothetical protein